MHRRLRGGSMTLLLVTPGVPASGARACTRASCVRTPGHALHTCRTHASQPPLIKPCRLLI